MSTSITVSEFKVDLKQLEEAINKVNKNAETISYCVGGVNYNLSQLGAEWSSPAYQTIDALLPDVSNAMNQLMFLMYQMIDRMKAAYQNYSSIELDNVTSLTFG